MSTGYTAGVQDGTVTEFRAFALICAREFGACIMQRDDPMSERPKHREPTDYHVRALAAARERLARAQSMTVEAAGVLADAEYAKATADYYAAQTRSHAIAHRYFLMLRRVEKWTPPTAEHSRLKAFMVSQLTESAEFDSYEPTRPVHRTGAEWLEAERATASKDVGYHENAEAEEQARCAESNAWIDALYASLEVTPC